MGVLLGEYLGTFATGLGFTLRLTVIAFTASVLLGLILATFRISPIAPLRWVGMIYVEIFRNIPLVTLLILMVYGLPYLNIDFDNWLTAPTIAMTLVGTAFACETFRTGINTVSRGEVEAARAIGLPFTGIIRHLLLPQAVRSVISPIVTLFIGVLLSSSLAAVVGVRELTATASYINNREALGLLTFTVAAGCYAAISLGAAWFGSRMELRWRVVR